jgi:hypothetical protein
METTQVDTGSISHTTLKIIDEDMEVIRDELLSYSMMMFGVSVSDGIDDEAFDEELHKKLYEKLYQ